jgi:hypothetical protein
MLHALLLPPFYSPSLSDTEFLLLLFRLLLITHMLHALLLPPFYSPSFSDTEFLLLLFRLLLINLILLTSTSFSPPPPSIFFSSLCYPLSISFFSGSRDEGKGKNNSNEREK